MGIPLNRKATCCPHKKHYGLGLCQACYSRKRRNNPRNLNRKADCCPDQKHFALGLCQTCYHRERLKKVPRNKHHKEQANNYQKAYRLRNIDACKAYDKAWKAKNKARVLAQVRERQLKKRLVRVGNLEEIYKIYERARYLRQWFDVVVDHIVPLKHGGSHSVDNLQIIYASENLKKGTNPDYQPKIIFV